ncbi:MAG: TIGR00282 family metallophosphoesterase [bacterium]
MPNSINILFIGDIVGSYGRAIVKELLPGLKAEYNVDLTIANGENSAHGYSITEKIYNYYLDNGIDVLTMGNHTWEKKELLKKANEFDRLARPANFPAGTPGKDYIVVEAKGKKIGVVNLLGRVFMQCVDCPFQAAEKLLPKVKEEAPIVIVDMHAEATSEKVAMGLFLDGKVSTVVGTHTHVMTADNRVLPGGTGYISDIGMVGSQDSVIGMQKEQILKKFITQLPEKFEPATTGPGLFNAVLIMIDSQSGKTIKIERITRLTAPPIDFQAERS